MQKQIPITHESLKFLRVRIRHKTSKIQSAINAVYRQGKLSWAIRSISILVFSSPAFGSGTPASSKRGKLTSIDLSQVYKPFPKQVDASKGDYFVQ